MSKINLFFDTTNLFCATALYDGIKIIDEYKIPVNKNVTDLIHDSIFNLLSRNNLDINSIENIYFNIGPGSFTGVRISVVVAKALYLIANKVKFLALDSLTLQMDKLDGVSFIDAKSKKYYYCEYRNSKLIVPPSIITVKEFEEKYKNSINYCSDSCNWTKWINHLLRFKKVDVTKLEPLYIKEPL